MSSERERQLARFEAAAFALAPQLFRVALRLEGDAARAQAAAGGIGLRRARGALSSTAEMMAE